MKFNISHWTASLVSVPVAVISGAISMIAFDIHLIYDMLIGAGAFFAAYLPTQSVSMNRQLQEYGLTKSEYKYINTQLRDAREKLSRLRKSYSSIRSLKDAKLIYDINRLIRTVLKTVEDDPKKFFGIQQFFHSNLDSAVNTIEQYLFLYKMPGKSKDEKIRLHETRLSLLELKRTIEANLSAMNKTNYQSLDVERDIISINNKRSERKYRLENKLHKQQVNLKKKETEKETVNAYRGEENDRRE
ncbi:5-bromo-4-chloroindolyl phosphate hydrolysis family protein [Corticicoccus populi]|uniref:5-bromo-4-chloroindolyl phosphate hydrolysis family protein n=1 Tax=Corticicoccus populi TaxID=1812821 RepID=A0ABW5WSJ6_9STAP